MFTANREQIDKAKELSLKFTFNSEHFENLALQQYYANVEAIASVMKTASLNHNGGNVVAAQ